MRNENLVKNQNGSVGVYFMIGMFIMMCVIGGIVAMQAVSFHDNSIQAEIAIKAKDKSNSAEFDTHFTTVKEMMQVTDAYASDFKKTYTEIMEGRYADKPQVMMNWIKEQNPNLDSKMYEKVQNQILIGRKDFKNAQQELVDQVRAYESTLNVVSGKLMNTVVGMASEKFPRIDLEHYTPVISENTAKAFETRRAEPMKLR